MKKILALDPGDVWTGTALSDSLGISAKPYKTIKHEELEPFLHELLAREEISYIIIGCPITMSGEESAQTKKVIGLKELYEKKFPQVTWILWDERLSSKRAIATREKKIASKEQKISEHSVAAAFILQSYLDYQAFKKNTE